jgi:hypothetical protein
MRRRKIPQRTHNSCNEFEQNGHGNYDWKFITAQKNELLCCKCH